MKRFYKTLLCLATVLAGSCSKNVNVPDSDSGNGTEHSVLCHEEIILGEKLDNPYTVANVKSAFDALYPTKAGTKLDATDLYVRFLPADKDELALLTDKGVELVDHPIDYQIVRDGDFYHDPSLDEREITWQYAVVPRNFEFPEVRYEIIDECFIADDNVSKAYGEIDWAAVERESFRLTGNGDLLDGAASTRGGGANPSGRITIVDDKANGGKPFGVAGVKVECNVFVKFSSTYTDRDGYYRIPKKFSAKPRYRLVFKNTKGFSIGFNWILYPASISTLGVNPPEGVNLCIDKDSDTKLFQRSAVNNSAYEFYDRCTPTDLGIALPPSDICFWLFNGLDASSAVMLHHGTVLNKNSLNVYFMVAAWLVDIFGPDITLGMNDEKTYDEIYSATVHELAHASHFSIVGRDYWNKYILYIISSFIGGKDAYGDGTGENAGYCAVGEMWGYFIESELYRQRYGGSTPSFGCTYWFHPQIMTYLNQCGITASDIQKAMDANTVDVDGLRQRLSELYADKKTIINQAFNRYE